MAWSPPGESKDHPRDPRLDRYRERAAILTHPPAFEVPHGYMTFADGSFDDWLVRPGDLDENLGDWSANQSRYGGQVFDVEWLDAAASRHVRVDVLGINSPQA